MSPAQRTSTRRLSRRKASEFAFKSRLDRPIDELSDLEQSLLFAEVSMISYLNVEQCNLAAGSLGFTDGKVFEGRQSRAHWFQNRYDSVVVFRGGEDDEWNAIQADENRQLMASETAGEVHAGFKREADDIWPTVEAGLEKNDKPIWFCGHSIGGALASIGSWRCMLSYLKMEPEGLFTFGSPRVGCKQYVNYVKVNHRRWVNHDDPVSQVPMMRHGYRHSGQEMYLDRMGQLQQFDGWRAQRHRLRASLSELRTPKHETLEGHAATDYVDAIFKLVRAEHRQTNRR